MLRKLNATLRNHSWHACSGDHLPGTEPGMAMGKVNTIPTVLSLQYFWFFVIVFLFCFLLRQL